MTQIYASKVDSKIDRPVQELKAFAKTKDLDSGDSQKLAFKILANDMSYCDEEETRWILEPGSYEVKVGASSREIKLVGVVEL